ncbi:hypothetical protein E1B28_002340 [Marasmius oreades]|uniref:Uncharacterized protein n=1 Tax=Marasmius oreades TaxID=181124 RepID=A0A9P7RNW9_9AGAR|nr:uncharacterized protein E1B28_002340 [Marasmius oreades]KAG7086383.1 hypothetical protein E1B28_002340 [Marasmius oreades]
MLNSFPAVTQLRSSLLTQPLNKDAVPPTEELESLFSELKILKQRSVDRTKKAESDVRIVEESFRRMKDRERDKGKGRERPEDTRIKDRDREKDREKARERGGSRASVTLTEGGSSGRSVSTVGDRVEKIKKERDHSPPTDITTIRQRLAQSGSSGPTSSKVSYDKGSEDKKKKKKRKRDEGSEVETEPSHVKSVKAGTGTSAGSATPQHPSLSHSSSSNAHGHPNKGSVSLTKTFPSSASASGSTTGYFKNLPDFSLPSAPIAPLLPTRPQYTPVQKHYSAVAEAAASSSLEPSTSQLPSSSDPSSSQPPTSQLPLPRHPHLPKYEPILHGPPSSHPAHPLHPLDIHDDFSKLKAPAQILVGTFYASIEPWIRAIKEEDVGFLEWEGDIVEPFVMPKLGRWYESVWDDLDNGVKNVDPEPTGNKNWDPHNTSFAAPEPQWDPSTLKDEDLQNEEHGHGPLTERLISALMPIEGAMNSWKGVKAAEDAMEGRPGGSGAAASKRDKVVSVADLETRIRDTMRAYGLMGPRSSGGGEGGEGSVTMDASGMPDYSEKVDDPIATALRHAQAELRTVSATNRARKLRVAAIAKDRLSYQEYLDLRDSLDKNINLAYAKLQKRDSGSTRGRKKGKKDKDKERGDSVALSVNGVSASVSGTPAPNANGIDGEPPPPCPAALGLGPDPETNHLVVAEHLNSLVETRRKWVDTVGGVFEAMEKETPGRIWGIPQRSIYEGLEAEVEEILKERMGLLANMNGSNDGPAVNGHVNGAAKMDGIVETGVAKRSHLSSKGKERQRVDEMDIS